MIDSKSLVPVDPNDTGAAKDFLKKNGVSLSTSEYARVCELLQRRPTIVELHIFNVMWSEHCSYKSPRGCSRSTCRPMRRTSCSVPARTPGSSASAKPRAKSWGLVMAHESHNHPSQVLPVEGAATGIGGIVRDVYCMGAEVVGVLDPLRFGDPDGPNARPRARHRARRGRRHLRSTATRSACRPGRRRPSSTPRFDDNCLVNVVALGVVAENGHHSQPASPKKRQTEPYDSDPGGQAHRRQRLRRRGVRLRTPGRRRGGREPGRGAGAGPVPQARARRGDQGGAALRARAHARDRLQGSRRRRHRVRVLGNAGGERLRRGDRSRSRQQGVS